MTAITLTDSSLTLFTALVKDAGNWSGTPLWGGNVGGSAADNGNLTDLKIKGLVTTFEDEGLDYVEFTPLAKEYAAELGLSTAYMDFNY